MIQSVLSRPYFVALACLALAFPCAILADEVADIEFAALQTEAKKSFKEGVMPFVKTYCMECHSNRRTKGGLNFEPALKNPGESSASRKWLQAYANVNAHDMPPDDSDQPSPEERQKFLDSLGQIKYLSAKDPGPFAIRRLTKVEYGNTLHDLFGVDRSVAQELPDEVAGQGYLNSLSPMQTEQYLDIANEVLDRLLASPGKPATEPQKRLLGELPAAGSDERESARHVVQSLARKAYRRPPSPAEVDTLLGVFDLGRKNKLDYTASLRLMFKAILVSPQFLFIDYSILI